MTRLVGVDVDYTVDFLYCVSHRICVSHAYSHFCLLVADYQMELSYSAIDFDLEGTDAVDRTYRLTVGVARWAADADSSIAVELNITVLRRYS